MHRLRLAETSCALLFGEPRQAAAKPAGKTDQGGWRAVARATAPVTANYRLYMVKHARELMGGAALTHSCLPEAKAISAGHDPGMADATIAGIAKAHDLVIMTRNPKHFQAFGIEVMSPDKTAQSA